MAQLGKKFTCFNCGAKFYDLGKAEAVCPRCSTSQKDAPAKKIKKEKPIHLIEDDFAHEPEAEAFEDGFSSPEAEVLESPREDFDPGNLRMDDYDE